jgi:hypothetical protein
MANTKNINRLKRITTRAKAIRKAHPNMQWVNAVRQAAKELKSGKVSGTKKKSSPKKKKKVGAVKRTRTVSSAPRKVGTVAHTRSKLKQQLNEQLAWALLAKESAAKVRDRKKKAKKVTEIKRELRAINGIGKKRRR